MIIIDESKCGKKMHSVKARMIIDNSTLFRAPPLSPLNFRVRLLPSFYLSFSSCKITQNTITKRDSYMTTFFLCRLFQCIYISVIGIGTIQTNHEMCEQKKLLDAITRSLPYTNRRLSSSNNNKISLTSLIVILIFRIIK